MIWAVFLTALAALALLGRTRLGFRGEYTRQNVGVWLRVGVFQWRLYPWKEKTAPQEPRKEKKTQGTPKPEKAKPPILSPSGVFQLVRRLLPVALEGADAFRRRLQVDVLRLDILAGAPDPAEAAERYGQINALLGVLWQPVTQVFHVQDGRVRVEVDFGREAPALYGTVSLSLTASQLLWLGLRYGPRCLGIFLDVRKQEKSKQNQQRKAA